MTARRLAVLLCGAPLLVPGPASASCAGLSEPLRLDSFDVAFAGEVVSTQAQDRLAVVRVLDVWRGPDLPPQVVVLGGETAANVFASNDRTFKAGQLYAFFPLAAPDLRLRDTACTPTALLTERAALDPPGVRAPVAGSAYGGPFELEGPRSTGPEPSPVAAPPVVADDVALPVFPVAVGAVLLAGVLLLLRRVRRQRLASDG